MSILHFQRLCRLRLGIVASALALFIACAGPPAAAAPPIGPPDPVAPVKELPVQLLITNQVRAKVDQVIANANVMAAKQTSVRVKTRVKSFKAYDAGMSATTYTDRPNQRYVRIPYMVGYEIYDVEKHTALGWIPTSITRQLSQSITIQVFCDRWEAGKGSLKLVTAIDKPYMDNNQGTLEQVVDFFLNGQLTAFIDAQVRQQINAIPITNSAGNLPFDCNGLGVDAGVVGVPKDDVIRYSYHPSSSTPTSVLNQVTLTLQSIKRLAAHDLSGHPLYAASESPTLEVYANQFLRVVQLPPLLEGQQVPLTAPAIVMPKSGLTALTVLMNLKYATVPQPDSATRVFGQNVGYGNGVQTLRVRKSYWTQANPKTGAKPYQNFVDAYEVTFRINSGNLVLDAGSGTAPTPGQVKPGVLNPAVQGTLRKAGT
jgi:hypothetical protein